MKAYIQLLLSFSIGLLLTGCGSPEEFLNNVIASKGYIPYASPMASSGVGTLVRGSPQALKVVAPPQTCFPDEWEGEATELRWVQNTDLPYIDQNVEFGFNAKLSSLLLLGTPIAKLNLKFKYAKKVQLSFEGASIASLNEIRFFKYFNRVDETCKYYLEKFPFVTQALRVNGMKFNFYTSTGAKIKLTPELLGEMMQIGVGVKWNIENTYTLNIETPKFIGYQVGLIGNEDQNGALIQWMANHTTRDGQFAWEVVGSEKPHVQSLGLREFKHLSEPLLKIPVGVNLLN
ncbi:MAG: hypothetical protein KDD22_03180 [Bdellovibrionales bacterium]|nr:hypothetical protein [Bdellovibrionales bacterium]